MKVITEPDQLRIYVAEKLQARLDKLNTVVAPKVAEAIDAAMKENTLSGRGFGNDRYDDTYVDSYKKVRRRAGLNESPVTLRYKTKSIENTRIETTAQQGSTIRFQDGNKGKIFKYHHEGIQYSKAGLRMRSIFPKTDESIPAEIRQMTERLVGEVLRGNQ